MTFGQFEALLDRRTVEKHFQEYRAGIVASAIYNASPFRDEDAELVHPLDFVSGREPKEQTLEEQIAVLTRIFKCGPGRPAKA